ncbi:MoxR family ATPase [Microbacterium sp.]|uniref:AAA family ATPase n=1 Tax=Microbacterium sp. TaxID=51671 RepID=UPI0027334108|nr:MoxR family ATPase [Microbacterium sp.]MDP3950264.1 MoxR family ATPase [Microbacterium sp.]
MTNTSTPALHFENPAAVRSALSAQRYLTDAAIATTVHLADALSKPLLVEGPAGTGKTELALSVAAATGSRLIRLQCYHGIDESRALYEWDYRKQLLAIQAAGTGAESDLTSVFSEEYLLSRPLLAAVRSVEPVVLLIDEVDQLDVEAEALLLEFLSGYQVTVPELGTLRAVRPPLVFLTSNGNRDISDALKRRCLYLHIGYPSVERESEIIHARVPGIDLLLAERIAEVVAVLRTMDFRKHPSVAETLDWARTLQLLGTDPSDAALLEHANVLLKSQSDIELLKTQLTATP